MAANNRLIYGDNLEVLRSFASESVGLVYLDPPFNSNRSYNVLFANQSGDEAQAQIEAFDDTWTWSHESQQQYQELLAGDSARVSEAIEAMRQIVGTNDVLAYLVMMTPRLVELHRVLKPAGSLYLHCDPTASHYLKIILDSIFSAARFRNEIVWKRTTAKGGQMNRLPANHDIVLAYSKGSDPTWHEIRIPYDPHNLDEKTESKYRHADPDGRRYRLDNLLHPEQGRRPNLEYELMGVTRTWRWSEDRMEKAVADGLVVQTAPGRVPQQKRYLDEQTGRLVGDVWTDINVLNSQAAERLGYPTQKPLALMERIITSSTNEGDVVLDPFCGCGTTVDAAQSLRRRWIGIDITYLAIDLIDKRLRATYGENVTDSYTIEGIPHDMPGAKALFHANPFDFERWAVSLVNGQPNQKQVGDLGVDGRIRFALELNTKTGDVKKSGTAVISVKGGKTINPSMVRDLDGTAGTENAAIGLLIVLTEPTKGMKQTAAKGGTYTWPVNGQTFPRIQIITVQELLAGKRPDIPPLLTNPYKQAKTLLDDGAEAQALF